MKKLFFTIIFLSLLILPKLVQAETTKVALIGSSSFVGGCSGNGFKIQLEKTFTNKSFTCFAKSGESASYFKQQFDDNVKGKGYKELIIYAGLNGLSSNLSSTQQNLSYIFKTAKAEGMSIIVMSAQPFKGYGSWTQAWGDNLIENHKWLATKPEGIDYFVDIYSIVKDSTDEYKMNSYYDGGDHLHMNQKGQDLMFQKISEIYNGTFSTASSKSDTPVKVSMTVSELDNLITKPILQIRIPGLNFSDSIELYKEGTKTYIYNSFFQQYIVAVYKYSVVAISVLAVVMIIVAGIQWLTSGGSPERIKNAQKRIGQSIIGLIIISGSYIILYTINPYLVGFSALRIQYFEDGVYDSGPSITNLGTTTKEKLTFTGFDELFKSYTNCTGLDWRLLKAEAFIESGFNSSVVNSIGFAGLFQTKEAYCKSSLGKYNLGNRCSNLLDPETSTMVGTAMMLTNLETIKKYCPTLTDTDSITYYLYIGHQSGWGALQSVLQQNKVNNCDYTKAGSYLTEFWKTHSKGAYADCDKVKRCYTVIANEGDRGAKKMIAIVRELGAPPTVSTKAESTLCPLTTKSMIGKAEIK